MQYTTTVDVNQHPVFAPRDKVWLDESDILPSVSSFLHQSIALLDDFTTDTGHSHFRM
jgi:hypothetical protein